MLTWLWYVGFFFLSEYVCGWWRSGYSACHPDSENRVSWIRISALTYISLDVTPVYRANTKSTFIGGIGLSINKYLLLYYLFTLADAALVSCTRVRGPCSAARRQWDREIVRSCLASRDIYLSGIALRHIQYFHPDRDISDRCSVRQILNEGERWDRTMYPQRYVWDSINIWEIFISNNFKTKISFL